MRLFIDPKLKIRDFKASDKWNEVFMRIDTPYLKFYDPDLPEKMKEKTAVQQVFPFFS